MRHGTWRYSPARRSTRLLASAFIMLGASFNGHIGGNMQAKAAQVPAEALVGIGTSEPSGALHVKSAPNAVGALLQMPSFHETAFCNWDSCKPGCFKDRLAYTYGVPMQWRGGEQRFGKWRQFSNWDEHGWTLAYNNIFDYTANWCAPYSGWRGKDVEAVSTMMRFDVGEGISNFWELIWSAAAPPYVEEGNLNPGFGKGAGYYIMTQGCGAAQSSCSTPSAELHISGPYGLAGVLSLRDGTTGVDLKAEGVPVGNWGFGDIFTIEDMNGRALMAFPDKNSPNSGNVGIGTTAPGHKLTVVGTAGLTTGTAWTQVSDGRYKDVQAELKGSSLEKIMALRPVAYKWNSLYQGKYGQKEGVNYGFIAQEVKEVIPELVTQDQEGYFWYNPSGFEALLTAAAQERQRQIEALKTEIKELRVNLVKN